MKLAWISVNGGEGEVALWCEDEVVRLGPVWPEGPVVHDMMALIAAGTAGLEAVRIAAGAAERRADLRLPTDSVGVLPPVPRPPRIFALARNYGAHAAELGGSANRARTLPQIFMKPPAGTLNHHRGTVPLVQASRFPDYEVELAVVLGRRGFRIPADRALDHVFGYTVLNDVSERQLHADAPGREKVERDPFFDWLNGKWLDGSCPMGPCVATADAVPDPHALRITCHVGEEMRQDDVTGSMIHKVPDIIAFLSSYLTLEAGDVISTGTPAGVGKARGKRLEDGDVLTSTIEGIGTLVNTVRMRVEERS